MNWTAKITDLRGDACKDQHGNDLTVGEAATMALLNTVAGDEKLGATGKLALFTMAQKIANEQTGTISAEDVATVIERAGAIYPAIVIGRMAEHLTGAA